MKFYCALFLSVVVVLFYVCVLIRRWHRTVYFPGMVYVLEYCPSLVSDDDNSEEGLTTIHSGRHEYAFSLELPQTWVYPLNWSKNWLEEKCFYLISLCLSLVEDCARGWLYVFQKWPVFVPPCLSLSPLLSLTDLWLPRWKGSTAACVTGWRPSYTGHGFCPWRPRKNSQCLNTST